MTLDPTTWPPLLWFVAAVALLVGYALGALLTRRGEGGDRIRELERQLDASRDEFDAYREQVSGHFTDTSKHLRDLALQYRTVYEHLADGARTLCPDSAVRIEAQGLAKELLPAAAQDDAGEEEAGSEEDRSDDTHSDGARPDDAPAAATRTDPAEPKPGG